MALKISVGDNQAASASWIKLIPFRHRLAMHSGATWFTIRYDNSCYKAFQMLEHSSAWGQASFSNSSGDYCILQDQIILPFNNENTSGYAILN